MWVRKNEKKKKEKREKNQNVFKKGHG